MKTPLVFLTSALLANLASAEFETWTNKAGKAAELELISVSEQDGEKTGEFKMRSGNTVSIKASDLSENDAKKLADAKPGATSTPAATPVAAASAFDEIFEGNLLKLEGKSLKKFRPESKPAKYYIFYYTVSWCGPCQQYSPTLVDFYNKNKNSNFEIVLITSDADEGNMEDYAKAKKMPWPQLKLSRVDKFKKQFNHQVTGIPSVITCDMQGNIISRTESIPELAKLVK